MASDVEEIKNRLSILDVVGAQVKLKRAGKSWVGLCPFHKEKTPSFHVSPERGTFHCFGCGVGGDVFTFVEKAEGLDFKEALKQLAEKAGVKLKDGGGEDRSKKDRLYEVMEKAVEYYLGGLGKESDAYQYALSRGLHPETVTTWRLGYAPDAWRALLEHLTTLGFSIEELKSAGLIKEADGKPGTYYDRFRNRLMFPIRDLAGRTVGFTGRSLSASKQGGVIEAKYLNSPETELYRKSEILFGMDRAKDAIRTRGFAILVEGQMDLLSAHQADFTNTVALSGTALTVEHLKLMMRYSPNLLLALDADAAGLSASYKSALMALGAGMRVKAARLPAGKDPADLIQEDPKDFAKRVADAKTIPEFFLAALEERERDQHRLITSVERIVLPLIKATPSPLEQDHFVTLVARALGLSTEAVRLSLKRAAAPATLEEPALAPRVGAHVGATPAASRAERERLLRAAAACYPKTELAQRITSEYARIIGAALEQGEDLPEADLFAAGAMFGADPQPSAADDLLRALEESVIRDAYQEAVVSLRRAEASGTPAEVKSAEAVCHKLSAQLASLSS